MNLNATIVEVAKLIHLIGGDKAVPRLILDPGLSRIQVDPRLVDWILAGLATRALGAMGEGNELVISTADREIGPAAAREMDISPGTYVQVDFTLAGAELRRSPRGRLAGINMTEVPSAVRQIVQRYQGAVSSRNDGESATVAVLFPRMTEPTPADRPSSERKLMGPLILLVDDQPGARELTRQLLDQAGYLVLEAAGREEAEVILHACRVDLVILLGAHDSPLVKDHPHVRTISAREVTSSLLEIVRREVGEPPR